MCSARNTPALLFSEAQRAEAAARHQGRSQLGDQKKLGAPNIGGLADFSPDTGGLSDFFPRYQGFIGFATKIPGVHRQVAAPKFVC